MLISLVLVTIGYNLNGSTEEVHMSMAWPDYPNAPDVELLQGDSADPVHVQSCYFRRKVIEISMLLSPNQDLNRSRTSSRRLLPIWMTMTDYLWDFSSQETYHLLLQPPQCITTRDFITQVWMEAKLLLTNLIQNKPATVP